MHSPYWSLSSLWPNLCSWIGINSNKITINGYNQKLQSLSIAYSSALPGSTWRLRRTVGLGLHLGTLDLRWSSECSPGTNGEFTRDKWSPRTQKTWVIFEFRIQDGAVAMDWLKGTSQPGNLDVFFPWGGSFPTDGGIDQLENGTLLSHNGDYLVAGFQQWHGFRLSKSIEVIMEKTCRSKHFRVPLAPSGSSCFFLLSTFSCVSSSFSLSTLP